MALWRFTAGWAGAVPTGIPGADWFSFVVVGWAFLKYLEVSLFSFGQALREEQLSGTAELLLSSPQRETTVVLALSAFDYVRKSVVVALFLAVATLFGVQWRIGAGGIATAFLALGLTLGAYVGIGLLTAAFTVTFKKGNALAVAATAVTTLFGGVLYPVESLGRLAPVSSLIPTTWAGRALRSILLGGAGVGDVARELLVLALFAALLLPAGAAAIRLAVARAKRNGSLGSY